MRKGILLLACTMLLALCAAPGQAASCSGFTCAYDFTITEGQPFTKVVAITQDGFACCINQSASIDWGDGTSSSGATADLGCTRGPVYCSFSISGSHDYPEEGQYTVTVTSHYDLCSPGPGCVPYVDVVTEVATVQDAPLSLHGSDFTAPRASQFSGVVATFTDADPAGTLGDYSATVDWGDGTSPSVGTIRTNGTSFSVSGSHVYPLDLLATSYTVTTHVLDAGGSQGAAQSNAQMELCVPGVIATTPAPGCALAVPR